MILLLKLLDVLVEPLDFPPLCLQTLRDFLVDGLHLNYFLIFLLVLPVFLFYLFVQLYHLIESPIPLFLVLLVADHH